MEDKENIDSFCSPIPKVNQLKKVLCWLVGVVTVITVIVFVLLYKLFDNLPDNNTIRHYQPESTVASLADMRFEGTPSKPIRLWTQLNKISLNLQKAVLISEDDTFYHHKGINWIEMKKAVQKM